MRKQSYVRIQHVTLNVRKAGSRSRRGQIWPDQENMCFRSRACYGVQGAFFEVQDGIGTMIHSDVVV